MIIITKNMIRNYNDSTLTLSLYSSTEISMDSSFSLDITGLNYSIFDSTSIEFDVVGFIENILREDDEEYDDDYWLENPDTQIIFSSN